MLRISQSKITSYRRQYTLKNFSRALCFLQLKKWDKAEQDCRRALELDPKNVKVSTPFLHRINLLFFVSIVGKLFSW